MISGNHPISRGVAWMMKSRRWFVLLALLFVIALGGIFYFYSFPDQEPEQIVPATVSRDCAPWDGTAFTIAVQYDAKTIVYISIWRSPEIPFPSAFEVPDEERQVGEAYILPYSGMRVELGGKVWFQRVEEGMPIEGRFRLTSERGEAYEGGFAAEWKSQTVYCG